MTKMISVLLASAVLAVSTSAQAAVVDLTAVSNATNNVRVGTTDQVAASVNASLGPVVDYSSIDLSATNAINVASATVDIDQTDGIVELANIALIGNVANNLSLGPVTQVALTANLTGGLDTSSITGSATNAVNVGSVTITVAQ